MTPAQSLTFTITLSAIIIMVTLMVALEPQLTAYYTTH